MSAPVERRQLAIKWNGRLNFAPREAANSLECRVSRNVARMSPPDAVKTFATRVVSDSGGFSETNFCESFFAMWRAVEG